MTSQKQLSIVFGAGIQTKQGEWGENRLDLRSQSTIGVPQSEE